jgi:hypothetical protein
MNIELSEMVWPQANYTKLIQDAVQDVFQCRYWMGFTVNQLTVEIPKVKTCMAWLTLTNVRQTGNLKKLIDDAIKLLIQLGEVKAIKNKMGKEFLYMATRGATNPESGVQILTNDEDVAHSFKAKALLARHRRSLNKKELKKLNLER